MDCLDLADYRYIKLTSPWFKKEMLKRCHYMATIVMHTLIGC